MEAADELHIVLFSFGFKYGTPVDVNYLMDMRFLPNPYWVEELKEKTGKEQRVADYVLQSEEGKTTLVQLQQFFDLLVTQNRAAGKKAMRIGIGCTGGRHRSVAVIEEMARYLRPQAPQLRVFHRDIDKDSKIKAK